MTASSNWNDATEWEKKWHGNCVNSYQEETKQIMYANRMGLFTQSIDGRYPVIDMQGKSVLDMGGGPYSLLLKCINFTGRVVDPCNYPEWIKMRYESAGIDYIKQKGEDYTDNRPYDEAWIYNVLQHVEDPEKVVRNTKAHAKIVRVCEWASSFISDGHIHVLYPEKLDIWFGGKGFTSHMNVYGVGQFYYGVFTGEL